ncbi:hypothetical protein [Nitrososphaera sp. AFS]|jgi:ribosomal protein S27E|uniref:hypothetical protein n=1 Tax=Nitrososphaera sp. AFS TaxID=2301191 RepID=UPI0013923341|nr:hypothetical protein [Nitrososphaera sp. AFS]NAL78600.1 hypothetical protein [Nitrososphaera sp. AFS]
MKTEYRKYDNSHESLIMPYEDMNAQQQRITGERFPDIILELCDNCLWSCMCFNHKGLIMRCPMCSMNISQIPMGIDEVLYMKYNNRSGLTLVFDRKSPMR